jgi:A/G-specific adenine glycosylase
MIHEKLLKWYDQNKRNLPWRHKRNPYRVWISEIMLQQTQVKTVIPYFNKWMQKYPNIKALKNANYDDVLKTWEGLGYYSRCKNIYNAAQIITKSFPKTYKDLISLPGIGDYTAKTILAIAYDKKSVGIDTNLERIGYRQLGLKTKSKRNQKRVARFLEKNQSISRPGDYNEALMDLGSSLCKSTITLCNQCPLSNSCKALQSSSPTKYPHPKVSKKIPIYDIAVSIIKFENRIFISKRGNTKFLPGLWEFPGGKIEKNESAEKAVIREVKEETNLHIKAPTYLGSIKHQYSHFGVNISLFISYPKSIKSLSIKQDFKWILFEDIDKYALPKANHKMLDIIKKLD